MSVNLEILHLQEDGTLEFGDYNLFSKAKLDNYEFDGDIYKVKTYSEITKLEKNGMFIYESVPGSKVSRYKATPEEVSFRVSSFGDVQFTLELEPNQEYEVYINDISAGRMTTHLSGKLNVSVGLSPDEWACVKAVKI